MMFMILAFSLFPFYADFVPPSGFAILLSTLLACTAEKHPSFYYFNTRRLVAAVGGVRSRGRRLIEDRYLRRANSTWMEPQY